MESLPKVVAKFSKIEDQVKKVVTDIGAVTAKVKTNPSLLLRRKRKRRTTSTNDRVLARPSPEFFHWSPRLANVRLAAGLVRFNGRFILSGAISSRSAFAGFVDGIVERHITKEKHHATRRQVQLH